MSVKGMQLLAATAFLNIYKKGEKQRQANKYPRSPSGKFMHYFKRRIGTKESRANALTEYVLAKEKCAKNIAKEIERLKKEEKADEEILNLNSLVVLNKEKGTPLSYVDQDFLENDICCKKYYEKKDEHALKRILGKLEVSYGKLAKIRAKQEKYSEASEAYSNMANAQKSLGKNNEIAIAYRKWNAARSIMQESAPKANDAAEPQVESADLKAAAEHLEGAFEIFNKKGQWKVALKVGQEAVQAYENLSDYNKVSELAKSLYDIASKNGADTSAIAYGLQKAHAEITSNIQKANMFLS